MTIQKITIVLLFIFVSQTLKAAKSVWVTVNDAFIEMRTGPGRGFPIFHVAEEGETIWIIKRKTSWFKVKTKDGRKGWVHRKNMQRTLSPSGNPVRLAKLTKDDFVERDWEFGVRFGDFSGARLLGFNVGWQFTKNLSTEIVFGDALGNFSSVQQVSVSVINQPFPYWRFSPYFGIGTGIVNVEPSATLVQAVDRTDETLFAASGMKIHMTERFFLRLEYRNYVILTTRENNDQAEEWSLGFSVFY